MKKIFALSASLILTVLLHAQEPFTIKGDLSNKLSGKIYLLYYQAGKSVSDSATLQEGVFTMQGLITGTVMGKIMASIQGKFLQRMFYIEKGTIHMEGEDFMGSKITGGQAQTEFLVFQDASRIISKKQKALMERRQAAVKGSPQEKAINDSLLALTPEYTKVKHDFINQYPASFVSLDLVGQEAGVIDAQTFEPLFHSLDTKLQNTDFGKELEKRLSLAKKISTGKPALPFVQNDTSGIPVALTSLRGKYVLLDFWASWCGPCRAENPNVVKAYEQFRNKNFEIISVSLDEKKEAWLNAIHMDGMPWIHVSDLKGWKNSVAVQYGVNAVPQNFLVDPQGMIIAANLRGEELAKTLQKLIAN